VPIGGGGALKSLIPSFGYILDAAECPGERSGDGVKVRWIRKVAVLVSRQM
jgi:hypothetical protein